ncbi:MAG: HAD-IIA family hydrolase [Anaerolineales bacterium]|jgi:4-nitrophenyl phosphatase
MTPDPLAQVRCFLFDMDGTVFLGGRLLPGAAELLAYLSFRQIPHYFLTNNSSRSRAEYQAKLVGLGLDVTLEQIFSSGQATALYLQQRAPGARIFLAGTPSLEQEFRSYGFNLTDEDPQYVVLGFDTTLTYAKLVRLCDFVRAGLPYIATHPDVNCPTETGFIPDIGAMMALVAASTGRQPDVIIGKPHPPIVQVVAAWTGYRGAEIAMVGDRLYTDIALGQEGIYTVLVLSGETKLADLPGAPFQPDLVVKDLAELNHKLAGAD